MEADVVGIVRLDAVWHPTRHQTESRGVIVKRYKGPLRPGMSIDFYGGGVCYDAPYKVGAVHVVYASALATGATPLTVHLLPRAHELEVGGVSLESCFIPRLSRIGNVKAQQRPLRRADPAVAGHSGLRPW